MLLPSNLSIIKIINSNVVVIIIVLAWFVSTCKLCSDLRDQAETSTFNTIISNFQVFLPYLNYIKGE
uniref:Uncharacterized protein n=1 Tax=virus sp. ctllZ17 TaxID=2827996 RepID=A0A8S5TAG9_9VIRU|nr:MAG TPA: hypothetical protein [virus sp. ctllZ17]